MTTTSRRDLYCAFDILQPHVCAVTRHEEGPSTYDNPLILEELAVPSSCYFHLKVKENNTNIYFVPNAP